MSKAKDRTQARGEFPRLNLSSETRAAFNELLIEAPKLGLDPERVEAAGLPGLRALLALKQAAESGTAKKRDAHLAQLQGTLRLLEYRKHPELVQQLQARAMALQGRGGDTEVAHVTVGGRGGYPALALARGQRREFGKPADRPARVCGPHTRAHGGNYCHRVPPAAVPQLSLGQFIF